MKWYLSDRFDPRAAQIADRHYNRQKIGTPGFAPPGRCLVLLTEKADALWITSYPFAEYVKHEWAGAWVCSCFRNENQYNRKNKDGHLSSRLILEAVAVTRWYALHMDNWDEPDLGMITFIDPAKVKAKARLGECYLQAGFQVVGETKMNHLLALQLLPEDMPEPCMPLGARAKALALEKRVVRPVLIA